MPEKALSLTCYCPQSAWHCDWLLVPGRLVEPVKELRKMTVNSCMLLNIAISHLTLNLLQMPPFRDEGGSGGKKKGKWLCTMLHCVPSALRLSGKEQYPHDALDKQWIPSPEDSVLILTRLL